MAGLIYARSDLRISSPQDLNPVSLEAWRKSRPALPLPCIYRICVDGAATWNECELAIHPHLLSNEVMLRTSPTPPRYVGSPVGLPIRLLEIAPAGDSVEPIVAHVFGSYWQSAMARAAWQVRGCGVVEAAVEAANTHWPASHIVRISATLSSELNDSLAPLVSLSLGWLLRLCHAAQTRMLIIESADGPGALTKIAQACADRGGPAVMVAPPALDYRDVHLSLYEQLVHDQPLDIVLKAASAKTDRLLLVAGSEREEALRPSRLGEKLAADSFRATVRRTRSRADGPGTQPLDEALADFSKDFRETWEYEFHERDGVVPTAAAVSRLRGVAGTPVGRALHEALAEGAMNSKRSVSLDLCVRLPEMAPNAVEESTPLVRGREYILGVQIGPQGGTVSIIGGMAILEELFHWTPNMEGAWVEIAVTGIDFQVRGSPVQMLWLPRHGASEKVWFCLVPEGEVISRLRVTVYAQNQIVQSFRLAAVTLSSEGEASDLSLDRLAEALDVTRAALGNSRHAARLEFDAASMDEPLEAKSERALTIVANDFAGTPVVTAKTSETFGVVINNNLPRFIDNVRKKLAQLAGAEGNPSAYRFSYCDQGVLYGAVRQLAEQGWDLYQNLFRDGGNVGQALEGREQNIQIAQLALDRPIPWPVIYDIPYWPNQHNDGGTPPRTITHTVCPAGFPAADGSLDRAACGARPDCVLHPDQQAKRAAEGGPLLTRESVVCPRHFWGFRHKIEMPLQQVTPEQQAPSPSISVGCARPANIVAGFHDGLASTPSHLGDIQALMTGGSPPDNFMPSKRRDEIVRVLKTPDLDIVYFYCHALSESAPGVFAPHLQFQDESKAIQILKDSELPTPEWKHRPLVFLNGCGTAAFSPDAISPFIERFAQFGASAVVGTDATVWEQLAASFAKEFFGAFLGGVTAGDAILRARRSLLVRGDPLALAYTLYGFSALVLEASPSIAISVSTKIVEKTKG